jgi:hypothetical protein
VEYPHGLKSLSTGRGGRFQLAGIPEPGLGSKLLESLMAVARREILKRAGFRFV